MTAETYAFQLGKFECVAIWDFCAPYPLANLAANADEQEFVAIAQQLGLGTEEIEIDFNCLLVRTDRVNVLIDAGFGTRVPGREGGLLQGLQAVGLEPDDIDWIAITHADSDHIGGILDAEGEPAFVNARYAMWQGAWGFWSDESNYPDWPKEVIQFVTSTYSRIEERTVLLQPQESFLPGFRLLPAVGHRHDHAVFSIRSGTEQLLHVGDAVVHPLFMARPDWYTVFDAQPERALAVKRRLLDWAVEQQALIFGTHFPFPGVGSVRRTDDRWEWLSLREQ